MRRNQLRYLRELRGWSQQDLADKSNYARRRISDLENDVNGVPGLVREELAKVFGCSPHELGLELSNGRGRPVMPGRTLVDKFRVPSEYDPRYGYSAASTLPAARREYPDVLRGLGSLAGFDDYLEEAPGASSFETTAHLLELRNGAIYTRVSPLEVGFDLWPVTERDSTRIVGHCRVPSLVTPDWLMIIQVTVRTPARYTMDALVLVRQPHRALLNLEYDGRGHDPRTDAERALNLKLATVRLTEREVFDGQGLTAHLRAAGYCLPRGKRR